MKNLKLFFKSVNILQKAYYNGTLEHFNCAACAVGNLVSTNCGYDVAKRNNAIGIFLDKLNHKEIEPGWTPLIMNDGPGVNSFRGMSDQFKKEVNATGYTIKELKRIEFAFEDRYLADENYDPDEYKYYPESLDSNNDPDGFKGLCNVLDVLMEIHEFDQELVKEKVFNKQELNLVEA